MSDTGCNSWDVLDHNWFSGTCACLGKHQAGPGRIALTKRQFQLLLTAVSGGPEGRMIRRNRKNCDRPADESDHSRDADDEADGQGPIDEEEWDEVHDCKVTRRAWTTGKEPGVESSLGCSTIGIA